LQYWHKINFAI